MTNKCDHIRLAEQVRKIKPTRRSVSGVYMFRGIEAIPYESTLERDFLIRHELLSDVLDIIPQPATIPFKAPNGRHYSYTPDFLVQYKLGSSHWQYAPTPMLVEVKPWSQLKANWRKWSNKFKAARRYAKSKGYVFRLQDESRIRDQVFKNAMFLKRFKRMEFSKEEALWVVDNLSKMDAVPVQDILTRHFQGIYAAEGVSSIWHLLAVGSIQCDMSAPINNNTKIWASPHD